MREHYEIARIGAVLALLAVPAGTAAQEPGLVDGANGATEVVFGDGCVVTYDVEGRRMGLTACSNDQLLAAQDAYAARLREEAEDAAAAAADERVPPQIIAQESRDAEVIVSRDCVVHYDANGERVRGRSTCSSVQLAEADAAQAAYRQEEGEPSDPASDAADPADERDALEVVLDGNGKARVVFGGGCTVSYDSGGRRTGYTRPCDASQVRRADEAMATDRQEQMR